MLETVGWGYMAANGAGSQMFTDNVTAVKWIVYFLLRFSQACQSISREETQHLVMYVGSRLQAVTDR